MPSPVDDYVQLPTPADTAGSKMDASKITRGGVDYKRQRVDVVNRYYQQLVCPAVTATGVPVNGVFDATGFGPLSQFALQVTGVVATATAWSVNLEVSIDGVKWTNILNHATADLDGKTKFVSSSPALFFHLYVANVTLGATCTGLNINCLGTV